MIITKIEFAKAVDLGEKQKKEIPGGVGSSKNSLEQKFQVVGGGGGV